MSDSGQPFTATELRMQLPTLEAMITDAYREWDALGREHDRRGLLFDTGPRGLTALAERQALSATYDRLRAEYQATVEAYHAASTDDSYTPRIGW